jgi:penicillin amidase
VVSDAGITQDLLGDAPAYVLAMRWTALDADAETVTPALAMNRARSVDEFLQATRGWVAPMQNMAVADVQGHIALVSPGRVPLRRPDNDLLGQVPAPGWDARYDWAGWLPWESLPRQVDPPAGWLASANQRVTPPGYPHYLTSEWAAPWRQRRIEHLLGERAQHSADSFAAMQADEQSLEAAVWLPWLQRLHSDHPLAAAALRELQGFDGHMAGGRAAPLIFWAWSRQFTRRVLADDVGEPLFERSLASRSFRDAMEGVLARNDVAWCDDRRTRMVETCARQADAAFDDALNELQARFGADVAGWRWDAAHQARSEHRPFSRVAALARWFELRRPVGGDTFTVNVSRVSLRPDTRSGELYLDEHGPSLRAIYDLGDPRQSRFMHSSGQSGLVFSPHYRDFAERWSKVQYVPLWGEAGQRNEVLLLQPEAVKK